MSVVKYVAATISSGTDRTEYMLRVEHVYADTSQHYLIASVLSRQSARDPWDGVHMSQPGPAALYREACHLEVDLPVWGRQTFVGFTEYSGERVYSARELNRLRS